MRTRLAERSVSVALLAAMLAGCAGTSQTTPARNATLTSVMSPAASEQQSLLYVSNATNVTVYTYHNGSDITQVGTLTGFTSPEGMCTDKAGDVWINDYSSRNTYEYAHGGSEPIFTIAPKVGYPYACAVDDATGNLAISYEHPNGHFRNYALVVVYPPGSTVGTAYIPKTGFYRSYFLAYDNQSNLYSTGNACGYSDCYREAYIRLFKLAPGQANFKLVQGAARQSAPSAIAWVNPSFLMGSGKSGDGGAQALKIQVTGNRSTVVGKVNFAQTFLTYGFSMRAGLVIVPDYAANAVQIYNLQDGSLVNSFTQGLSQPFSAVVSQNG
jgi:hypothetical protein